MLHEHLGDSALVSRTQSSPDEHVAKHKQETTEQQGYDVTLLKCGDKNKETDGCECNQEHFLGTFPLSAH